MVVIMSGTVRRVKWLISVLASCWREQVVTRLIAQAVGLQGSAARTILRAVAARGAIYRAQTFAVRWRAPAGTEPMMQPSLIGL
jgi:hypothetical protein